MVYCMMPRLRARGRPAEYSSSTARSRDPAVSTAPWPYRTTCGPHPPARPGLHSSALPRASDTGPGGPLAGGLGAPGAANMLLLSAAEIEHFVRFGYVVKLAMGGKAILTAPCTLFMENR